VGHEGRGGSRLASTATGGTGGRVESAGDRGDDPSRSDLAAERSRRCFEAAVAALRAMDAERPEAARDAALAGLAEAAREQDTFLHAAAHDLRNPLTAMRGQAQLMRRRMRRVDLPEADAARLDEGMAGIEAAAERLGGLIDLLLDAGWSSPEKRGERSPGQGAAAGDGDVAADA
jgi:signal transduction histidine kinase